MRLFLDHQPKITVTMKNKNQLEQKFDNKVE